LHKTCVLNTSGKFEQRGVFDFRDERSFANNSGKNSILVGVTGKEFVMGVHFRQQDSFVRIVEMTPALRRRIETTIENLIALLDTYDGDENLEEDDFAEEDDPAEEVGDMEPILGALEWHPRSLELSLFGAPVASDGSCVRGVRECSQEYWAQGGDADECEMEDDREESLGWCERDSQWLS
jgi:hypothetical protein